jgi:hypothetical protein
MRPYDEGVRKEVNPFMQDELIGEPSRYVPYDPFHNIYDGSGHAPMDMKCLGGILNEEVLLFYHFCLWLTCVVGYEAL